MSDSEEQLGAKVRGRPFEPGNKYGHGRPRGSRNKGTGLCQKTLEYYGGSLTKKLVPEAFRGNPTALRLCIERLMPVRRQPTLRFKLPLTKTVDDVAAASEALVDGVARGQLTPAEGQALTEMLEGRRRVMENQAQRDAVDVSNRPVPVIMIPAIVPVNDDEMQEMAVPDDQRNSRRSVVADGERNRTLAVRAPVPSLHHDQKEDAAPIPAAEPADPPAIDAIP